MGDRQYAKVSKLWALGILILLVRKRYMEVNDIIELENIEIKRQAVSNQYAPMTEKELLAKLKKYGEQEKFRDADDVISDMRSKYGL